MVALTICGSVGLSAADDAPDDDRAPWIPRGSHLVPPFDLEHQTIVNGDYEQLPFASMDAGGHSLELHPLALASLAWDSNPLAEPQGSSESIRSRAAAGLSARILGRNEWSAEIGGMVRRDDYSGYPQRSFTGGDVLASVKRASPTSLLTGMATATRDSDPVAAQPESVRRQSAAARLQYQSIASTSAWSAAVGGDILDYLEAARGFSEIDRDHRRATVMAAWNVLGGRGSMMGLDTRAEELRRPSDASLNGYRGAALEGRWRHALGVHSSIDLRLGAEVREFDAPSEDNPHNDDGSMVAPLASAAFTWGWDATSWLSLIASTGLADSVATGINASRRDALTLNFRHQLSQDSYAFASGWASRRTNSAGSAGQGVVIVDDEYLRVGLRYRLADGLEAGCWTAAQFTQTSSGPDSERLLAAIEMALAL